MISINTHVSLMRLFTAPALIGYTLVGVLMGVSTLARAYANINVSGWNIVISFIVALLAMTAGHYYNSFADHLYGLDRGEIKSSRKNYSDGSQVISSGRATRSEVLMWVIIQYVLFLGGCIYLYIRTGNPWMILPALIGLTSGFLYAPGFMPGLKYRGFPEYVGFAFGVGGCSLGYIATGAQWDWGVILVGIIVAIPFSTAWIFDQFMDVDSDMKKGVRNIAHVAYESMFPIWGWCLFGWMLSMIMLVYTINIGVLPPLAILGILISPMFGYAIVTVQSPVSKSFEKAGIIGLIAVSVYPIVIASGLAITLLMR